MPHEKPYIARRLDAHRISPIAGNKLRAFVWQLIAVALFAGALLWFTSNALTNLETRRITTGFAFIERPAGIPISEALIAYSTFDSNARAILVALLNTLLVSVSGIILATLIGVAVGVARLSKNWLLARVASAYVEFVRNVPLLAHLLFCYALLQTLPPARSAFSLFGVAFLSNRGLVIPALHIEQWWPLLAIMFMGILVVMGSRRLARHRHARTGRRPCVLCWTALPLSVLGLVAINRAYPVDFEIPQLSGFNYAGGITISPELTALLAGLSIYFGAFIAEIVRGGILGIPQGQWDAGYALGLNRGQLLKLIVFPQALRLIVPPTTNQYLDLAKSSSLAIAVGYPDLVAVMNGIITNTGQAIECIALIMATFLAFSLSISMLMNWYNAKLSLAERK